MQTLSIDAVRTLGTCNTIEDLNQNGQMLVEALGGIFFILAQIRTRDGGHAPTLIGTTPGHSWHDYYAQQNFHADDPVFHHALRVDRVFGWTELVRTLEMTPAGHRVMREAHDAGLPFGLTMPIHGRNTDLAHDQSIAIFSVAGPNLQEDNLATRGGFYEVGIEMFRRASKLGFDGRDELIPRGAVTARPDLLSESERSYLSWRAQGKSRDDIAVVLDKSPRAIRALADSARKKLGALDEGQLLLLARDHNVIP